jgi:hypothetical protein
MKAQLQKIQSSDEGRLSVDARSNQMVEMKETVNEPLRAYLLNNNIAVFKYTVWDLAKWADEGDGVGNQACAYLAGSKFRHRILGEIRGDRTFRGRVSNRGENDIPVIESQELAFKYFEKAAKLGHGLAMQSLGTCFEEGVGCKSNRRRCNQWLWRACLQHSVGAIELLDNKAVIPLEIGGYTQSLDDVMDYAQPGQSVQIGGPNLASLLVVFNEVIQSENYSLPPFAGKWATATVNNPVRQMDDLPRLPLIGSQLVKELVEKIEYYRHHYRNTKLRYCRRGAAKTATAQTRGAAYRSIENQIFFTPPFAACDERVTDELIKRWHHEILQLSLSSQSDSAQCACSVVCVHNENENNKDRAAFCKHCESDAIERLDAIAKGSVVLSLDEELPHRGHAAIFRGKDGVLKIETWKYYCAGESECVLAILAASGMTPYVQALFVAMDPNFLWPLIYDHGTVRAALEFVAPHLDWNTLIGPVKENELQQMPVTRKCKPGKYLRKCGNGFCTNLESYKSGTFKFCSRCNRRKYCSSECQRDDYVLHKLECKTSTDTTDTNLRVEVDEGDEEGVIDDVKPLKHESKLEEGQDCVVHGLISKPHYNGKVGVVGETTDDRIAVTLKNSGNVLSIRPSNLYCIGAFCRKRKKKSRVFECMHGLSLCSDCYLDFTTINILAKLKYNGQDMTSKAAIEQVEETHFSSFALEPKEELHTLSAVWPFECTGMDDYPEQRFILKALVEAKTAELSLLATVARTAFLTYGGAFTNVILRADTKLRDVAEML